MNYHKSISPNSIRRTLTQYHTTEEMIHKVGFENLYMCAANTL